MITSSHNLRGGFYYRVIQIPIIH